MMRPEEGWLYAAAVIDLYGQKAIANNIPNNNIFFRNYRYVAISNYFNRFVIINLVQ